MSVHPQPRTDTAGIIDEHIDREQAKARASAARTVPASEKYCHAIINDGRHVCRMPKGHDGAHVACMNVDSFASPASLAGTPEQTEAPHDARLLPGQMRFAAAVVDEAGTAQRGKVRVEYAIVASALRFHAERLSASPASSDVLTTARRTSAPAQLTDSSCEIERCGERQGVDIGWPSEPCEEPKGHAGLHRFVTRHTNGRLSETFWGAQISGTQPIAEPEATVSNVSRRGTPRAPTA